MLPRCAGFSDHSVQLGQGLLDQIQPLQHRPGQLGMVGIEVAGQRLSQIGDLRRIRPFANSARPADPVRRRSSR